MHEAGRREAGNIAMVPAPVEPGSPEIHARSSFYKNIILGRSIYYGLILYLGVLFHSFWIPLLIQALIAGVVIVGAARHIVDPAADPARFTRLTIGLMLIGSLTTLPYFVSFLMPDIFSGLLLAGAAVVLVGWQRERTAWRLFWLALLSLGALVHSTNVLILVCLAGLSILLARGFRQPLPWRGAGLILLAALIGVVGEIAFNAGISHVMGRAAVRPPFLSARLIADGPGAQYLHESCPSSGFALCAFRDRPHAGSDLLLWSDDPATSIFTALPADVQARVAREDSRFGLAVLTHHPLGTLATVGRNASAQVIGGGLREFNSPPADERTLRQKFPDPPRGGILRSLGDHGDMPIWIYALYGVPLTVAGLILMMTVFFRESLRDRRLPVAFILLGIVANGAICGAMSGPHDRYQDRVIWLVLLAAAAMLLAGVDVRLHRRAVLLEPAKR